MNVVIILDETGGRMGGNNVIVHQNTLLVTFQQAQRNTNRSFWPQPFVAPGAYHLSASGHHHIACGVAALREPL